MNQAAWHHLRKENDARLFDCVLIGALEGTRTPGLQVRNLSLYPLSYERAS